MKQYCGTVTLVGETNAGKSSLLNAFARAALAEVHHKRNLTREVMRAVITIGARQLVLEDTAGLNAEANDEIRTRRKEQALSAARHADLALWIVDAARGTRAVEALLKRVQKQNETQTEEEKKRDRQNLSLSFPLPFPPSPSPSPSAFPSHSPTPFVALNKIDLVKDKRLLLPLANLLGASGLFRDVFMLSATNFDGIDKTRETLLLALPEGAFLFEREGDTRTHDIVACETVRATLYGRLHDELPYEAIVESERCQQDDDGAWHIALTIRMKRESQRQILLIHEARLLKNVRERSQHVLQKRFASPVSLKLHLPRPRPRQR